jgi:CHASE3 domain sensor protein
VVPGPEPDPEPDWAAPAPEPDSLAAPPAPPRRPRPPGRAAGLARPTVAERASAATAKLAEGWPFGRVIGIAVLIVALFSLLAIGVGGTALAELTSARSRVVDTLDPAANHAAQLEVELLNQETGVRGYALSGKPAFLTPYTGGLAGQQQQVTMLRQLLAGMPATIARLNQVLQRADTWRDTYAQPTIAQVRAAGKPVVSPSVDQGKADFDQIRAALAALQADIAAQHNQATGTLHSAASALQATLVVIAVALLAAVLVLAFGLWRSAILPLSRLASDARQVAEGDFEHQVEPGGPAEMRAVGADVNRRRNCRRCRPRTRPWRPGRRTCSGPTPNSSSSPTWPRTTSRSRCARWPASASCCSAATRGGWTPRPTSTSSTRWTAPSGCRR